MDLHGKNIIGGTTFATAGAGTFSAAAAVTGEKLAPLFYEATATEVDQAVKLAGEAFEEYRALPPEHVASFLERAAGEIMALGDELIRRANLETALPEARLIGERARTVNQLKMFAEIVREGSWVEATIDHAIPDRKPLPKPDLRRMLIPLGPVAVFGASNFPLAYSVAGGDTASALAAGCPVVVKAHPAHAGTSELVARAIQLAVEAKGMPAGVFSMVHGISNDVGMHLARHPALRAIGFTGSLQGGRSLLDAAAARSEPIPVYAEMGSTNPVFILPGALKERGCVIADNLVQSFTLGVGQFCTSPGLVFGHLGDDWKTFVERAGQLAAAVSPGVMLHQGIYSRFEQGVARLGKMPGVTLTSKSSADTPTGRAPAHVFTTDARTFRLQNGLHEEVFGPSTVLVSCGSTEELEATARSLSGQLTATIHGTDEDLAQHRNLLEILSQKAGRLVFNQFPTGVEVCPSMQHGGPYPATTDSRTTSVGAFAIKRFARPVCFQNFPDTALPPELRNKNTRQLWRLVDNQFTKADA